MLVIYKSSVKYLIQNVSVNKYLLIGTSRQPHSHQVIFENFYLLVVFPYDQIIWYNVLGAAIAVKSNGQCISELRNVTVHSFIFYMVLPCCIFIIFNTFSVVLWAPGTFGAIVVEFLNSLLFKLSFGALQTQSTYILHNL